MIWKRLVERRKLLWSVSTKTTWAVMDQGLFAGSNFVVGVLLARSLEPSDYGAWSSTYSALLFLNTLHTALLIEPMLVLGSSKYRDVLGAYLKAVKQLHWRYSAFVVGLVAAAGGLSYLVGANTLGRSLMALALVAPYLLLAWLSRRSAYLLLEPRFAAIGGALSFVCTLLLLLLLSVRGWLDAPVAFVVMGIAALSSAKLIDRFVLRRTGVRGVVDVCEVESLHWSYGRWALIAGLLSWIPSNAAFIILPTFRDFASVATLRATMNIITPMLQFHAAMYGLFIPVFLRVTNRRKVAAQCGAILILISTVFWVTLVLFGKLVVAVLYAGRYPEVPGLLTYAGAVPVMAAFYSTALAYLRSSANPKAIAIAYSIASASTILFGGLLMVVDGVRGALIALTLSYAVLCAALAWFMFREEQPEGATAPR